MAGKWFLLTVAVLLSSVTFSSGRGDVKQTFARWRAVYKAVGREGMERPEREGDACSATVEETAAWLQLTRLFEEKEATGIMRHAWPRIDFYEDQLAAVVGQSVDDLKYEAFCSRELYDLICIRTLCVLCEEKVNPVDSGASEKMRAICAGTLPNGDDLPGDAEKEREAKEAWLKPGESEGPLTLEEVMEWREELVDERREEEEDRPPEVCSASVEMSVSAAYILRIDLYEAESKEAVEAELRAHPEYYADRLRWLKGAEKRRGFCGSRFWEMVCGWDGLCVECEKVKVGEEPQLAEACSPWTQENWEEINKEKLTESKKTLVGRKAEVSGGRRFGGGGGRSLWGVWLVGMVGSLILKYICNY